MQARTYVRSLKLMSIVEWRNYCKSGRKPTNIPSNPDKKYKDEGWISYGDWLGTHRIAHSKMKFLPFEEARQLVHGLYLKSVNEWTQYCKSGNKPKNLPYSPDREYRSEGWINWPDWLGTDTVAPQKREYLPFPEARIYARSLGLKSQAAWFKHARSKGIPTNIPIAPDQVYEDDGWKNWGDWLGTARIATRNLVFRPFEDARIFVRTLKLKNQKKWHLYCKSGKKPGDIPQKPERTYRNQGWISYGDWLGSFTVAAQLRNYKSFENARAFVHMLNMKSRGEWINYCKSDKKPDEIPANPNEVYKTEWIGWPDWLGYEERKLNIRRVIEFVRDMIKYNVLSDFTEDERHQIILHRGLIHLYSPQARFLRASLEGKLREDQLNKFVDSFGEDLPDTNTEPGQEYDEEIKTKSTDELDKLVDQEKEEDKDSLE
jgi:Phage-integrase repeat unit